MSLNNNDISDKSRFFRLYIALFIFFIPFIIYLYHLFSMQIISGEMYKSRAQSISSRTFTIPAQRGEIFDRNNSSPVVMNIDTFAVYITPAEIEKNLINTVLSMISNLLNIPKDQLEKKIPSNSLRSYQQIELASNVSFEQISQIAERKNELPGITWQSKPVRNFIGEESFSHIVGYVGDITREELKILYNKGYQAGEIIGKSGIEKQYDELLRGKSGYGVRIVDVKGRSIVSENEYYIAPTAGNNIILTIDSSIQELVREALGERMGAVVVLKPGTGEVLAMVSYPWYDPNIFNQVKNIASYQSLLDDSRKPLINRAIQSSYPPASTFKIIMTAGILQENAYPKEKTIECSGEINYGDRIFRCHIKTPGHGMLNLKEALAQSCDIYFWTVGRDYLGIDNIVLYSREFGLGNLTGIDLPGEISGFIPSPQWKERRFHERWLGGDTMNFSIGQGYVLTSPIQMANVVAMIVNDGIIYEPHLVKAVQDSVSGEIIHVTQPSILLKSNIDESVFHILKENMRSVITDGTAQFPLNIKTVKIAGKTGTGEVGLTDRWHSWFVAYAPYDSEEPDEQIVVAVIVEAANTWEWWAPYASAIIYQGIFAKQNYESAVRSLGFTNLIPQRERRE